MSLANPAWLAALALLPALVAAQAIARRRGRFALRFPAAESLGLAAGEEPAWRRRIGTLLLLAALAALVLALAGPQRSVLAAGGRTALVLVTDHSGSMQATDVAPDRLTAAKSAAHLLIDKLPGGVDVGVVGYSTIADVVQAPAGSHDPATQAIDVQQAQGSTATGDALALALGLIAADHSASGAVVLMSDGATNTGRDPLDVARTAATRHVPIFTVALGTPGGTLPSPDPFSAPVPVPPDPVSLRAIAALSGGRAFTAQTADQLTSIYARLGRSFNARHIVRPVTDAFAIGGLVLLAAGLGVSQLAAGRLP